MTLASDLTIYRDDNRYLIGRTSWQTCTSYTYSCGIAGTRREAAVTLAYWQAQPIEAVEAARLGCETPHRFEDAAAAGAFDAPRTIGGAR